MAEGHSRPVGRGGPMVRGSLLEMLKKRNEMSNTPSQSSSQISSPAPSVPSSGRGRAALLGFVKQSPEEQATSFISSSQRSVQSTATGLPGASQQSVPSRGRASILDLMKKGTPSPGLSESFVQPAPIPGPSGDSVHSMTKAVSDVQIHGASINSEPVSCQGQSGRRVDLHANYIRLKVEQGRGVFEYEVKYSPDIDSRPLRNKLLNQHTAALGGAKIFDGTILYLSRPMEQERTILRSEHPMDQSVVELTLIYKRQKRFGEAPQLYNVLFRRVMHALDLVQIGRQHFNSRAAQSVPQHRLELWPGYVTAIDEYEGGLQLCLNSTHRVLRTETVRDLINEVHGRQQSGRFRDAVMKELIGISVLTRYNNKVYRVDDIEWNETPLKEFIIRKDDKKMSIVDYYKTHWNIDIKDKNQPLLVHMSKIRQSTGESIEEPINLVPELCYLSGLTDSMRADFKLMKDVSQVTQISPEHRVNVAHRFVQEVKKNEIAKNLLANWGLSLDDSVVSLEGRVLDPEIILFGEGKSQTAQANADWNGAACRMPMLSTPGLKYWCLFYCQRDQAIANDFSEMFSKVGPSMGMDVARGQMIKLRDDRTETLLKELRQNISPQMEIMVTIFPTNRNDRYSALKKLCCVEMPIASQVIISRTISRKDKLKSITQKIALQINCKLGGTLWALKTPLDHCMVCGIDVHHAGATQTKHGSVAAFVASLDKPFTRWYSKICLNRPNQELIDSLKVCLITALKAYFKMNQCFPTRIIIYRDGVGDGQLDTIRNFEIKQLEDSFASIAPDYKPKLTVIIVQKRILSKIFLKSGRRLENPPPGTIVDQMITRRNYYDFYLVSQNVRQGTVSPTHYLVIYDGGDLKTDQLQRLTFKLCHLYYNWPGTVRVPAPCQYAHKLAALVGQNIQMEPDPTMAEKLYYL